MWRRAATLVFAYGHGVTFRNTSVLDINSVPTSHTSRTKRTELLKAEDEAQTGTDRLCSTCQFQSSLS
jgi:hypothetical protein